jgi:hypothetical protein
MSGAVGACVVYEPGVEIVAAPPQPAASARDRLAGLLHREGLLVGLVSIIAGLALVRLGPETTQDTWLSLVAGRAIREHGLHPPSLTYWTVGRPWIDQQWLAHLLFYGLYSAGGLILLGLVGVASAAGALTAAVAYARRNGATARAVGWLVALGALPLFFGAGNIRTQILVLPLFVAVLALLLRDVRKPSRHVFLVLPILVLWANLHGSVVVAAALVLLRAAFGVRNSALRLRSVALALAAVLACVVTPYGFDIVGYYQRTLLNPSFHSFVPEWGGLSLGLGTAPIFLLAAASIWLTARQTRRLGWFAVSAQLVLVVLVFVAVRNAVWLGLGSLLLLAPALDAELKGRELAYRRINSLLGVGGLWFALIALVAVLGRGTAGLTRAYPAAAGDVVARAAAADPGDRVFADERFGDWLMFEHPVLAGRVAYDVSFEQLSAKQVLSVVNWKLQAGLNWRSATRGAGVLVLELPAEKNLLDTYNHDPAWRKQYADSRIAVFVRS